MTEGTSANINVRRRRFASRTLFVLVLLSGLAGSLGCSSHPVSVERIGRRAAAFRPEANVFDSGRLSESTRTVLFSLALKPDTGERNSSVPDPVELALERLGRRSGRAKYGIARSEYLAYLANLRSEQAEAYLLESTLAAYQALIVLSREPSDWQPDRYRALRFYNLALQRWLSIRLERDPMLSDTSVNGLGRSFALDPVPVGQLVRRAYGEYRVSAEYEFEGLTARHRRVGIGVDLVAVAPPPTAEHDPLAPHFPREGMFRGIAAVLEPAIVEQNAPRPNTSPNTARASAEDPSFVRNRDSVVPTLRLNLIDPDRVDRWWVGAITIPTSADFTAPYATLMSQARLRELAGQEYFSSSAHQPHGVFLLEEFDSRKTPVIMVHGLASSPSTWLAVSNEILGDERLRRNFQIWHYRYPTGTPLLESAMSLRKDLNQVRQTIIQERGVPANPIVIGHGMGGILSRQLLQRSGNQVWETIYDVTPENLGLTGKEYDLARDLYFFEPLDFIDRLILIATPHRGSLEARTWIGRLGSDLAPVPSELKELVRSIRQINPDAIRVEVPPSVDELDPSHPVNTALVDLSIKKGVPIHTIVGQLGADPTDGVVTHDSSRLEDATSFRVVPGDHRVHQTPAAILEIKRILRQHLAEPAEQTPPSKSEENK